MMIEHSNIIYIRDLGVIGGVETFTYELIKKYKDYDIAVVYKTGNTNQISRIRKYCKIYKHINQKIKCDVAIINYDISIIDFIDDKAKIYQVIHGDYENEVYKWTPPTHDRIYQYIGITKHIVNSFKRITGKENVILGYNPLTIEKEDKKLMLVSATRLSKIKGKDRMIKLANALDSSGINYIWYVFTNDKNAINSPNVVYMKPRLDVGWWIERADYVIQLSDTEACSYTINEALYRNIPVIVTPLPYLEEMDVKNGVNSYIMNFDCSNIDYIIDNIQKIPKFRFNQLKDSYDKILMESKSRYEEDKKMKVRVKAKVNFNDLEANERRKANESVWECTKERADYLLDHNAIEIIEEIKEEKVNELGNPVGTRELEKELAGFDSISELPKEEKPKRKSKKSDM